MKYLLLLLIPILNLPLSAQDFLVDPANNEVRFELSQELFYQLKINEDGGIYSGDQSLHLFDSNDNLSSTYLDFKYDANSKGGSISVNDLSGQKSSESNINGYILYKSPGSTNPKIQITQNNGLEVYNNNNTNLMFRLNGQILSGYRNDGVETIRINTNQGGDGRITTSELELKGGSDMSEHFDIVDSDDIKAGLIVSVVEGTEGKLKVTDQKRDRKVVGIISGANGIDTGLLMGQKGSIADGEYPIALTGRVYVYASNENGKIKAGDFLTSSSTAGYAMRVKNMKKSQGAIIGKALTSMDDNEGFVLVLVNLQ